MISQLQLFAEFIILLCNISKCFIASWFKWLLPKKYKTITNDVILITGGNSGIGKCVALEIMQYKPKMIILWGRHESSLQEVSNEIIHHGVSCAYMVCDLSNRSSVYTKAKEVQSKFGPVTMLINNAGVVYATDIIDSNDEDIIHTMQTNTLAHCWTIKAFLPDMFAKNHGHVVTVSSVVSFLPIPGAADYAASKAAAAAYLESLTCELHAANKTGVYTTCVHPYLVDTEMFAGCSTRFPSLFPALDKQYVARRIVDAVLTNQHVLVLPRHLNLILAVKNITPTEVVLLVQKFTGVDKAMSLFQGRRKQKSQ